MYEAAQRLHLLGAQVEAADAEALLREGDGQRQPDLAEADHADARLTRCDAGAQLLQAAYAGPPASESPLK
jgi:hypothetical protein